MGALGSTLEGMDTDDARAGTTTDEMLAQAKRIDPTATKRTLEELRREGVMPAVTRTAQQGKSPVYLNPPGSEKQLEAVLHWRTKSRNPDWLRVLLWVDGWPIDLSRVHASLIKLMRAMQADLIEELAEIGGRVPGAEGDSLKAVAQNLAGRRGKNSVIPRPRNVSTADRVDVIELMLRSFLGEDAPSAKADLEPAKQILGINPRKARQQGVPEFEIDLDDGPMFGDPSQTGLDALIRGIEEASADELREAQLGANVLMVRLPMMASLVQAIGGSGSPLELFAVARDQPQMYLLGVALTLALNRSGLGDGIKAIGQSLALTPEQVLQFSKVAEMPQREVEANLAGDQRTAKRVEQIVSDAPLEAMTATVRRQGPRTR